MLPIAAARARQPLSLRPLLLARAAQPRLLARVAPLHITARLADARLRLPMRPLPPLSRPLPACFQSTAAESEPVKHVRTGAAPNEVTEHELEVPTESAPVEGPMENPDFHKGTVWFENIFPFKLGVIDPRTYFINQYASKFVEEERWRSLVPEHFPEGAEFQFRSAEPNIKEGGLYLKFRYRGGTVEEAVEAIQAHVRDTGVRSSFNLRKIKAFEVKGRPWVEDMVSRVPTSRLHVEFHGPDLTVEQLYREFRNYGRIMDVTLQPSSSKDVPRFASVEFVNKRSATSARNCIHGESIDGTRVHIGYEKKSNSFSLWNWMMANLRISVPILLAIAAVISYLVFDPLRVFFITNKLTGRFSFVKYAETAEELLSGAQSSILSFIFGSGAVKPKRTLRSSLGWAEREKEEKRLEQHFKQSPETLVLVSGPKGSGKSDLVRKALEHHKNKLVIHCEDLVGQPEHILISRLASQVNFSPSFGFMSQITTFMDAIITATTGAKAGLSTTKENEIRKILDCVTKAVTDLTVKQRQARLKALDELSRRDADSLDVPEVEYPVIVIEDYLGKENSRGEFLYSMLTEWAAIITAQYRVAHVVFVSDNPAAVRELGKVIPTKSVEGYILKDATPESALAYVQRRLPRVTTEALKPALDSLGGRLHDLDLLIQKVNAGQTPADAFDDMVHRAITELRKIGMGEDMDSSKRQWTDVQFWKVAQMLSKFEEVPFDNLCIHPIFKGDPSPLIQMERDGLIILDHANGRPYSLRPGKPIYRTAFKQMNEDEKLVATMGIRTAKQLMADEEKRLKSYEDEMQTLASLNHSSSGAAWWGPGTNVRSRIDFLAEKLGESSRKVVAWSDEETKFKKMLKLAE